MPLPHVHNLSLWLISLRINLKCIVGFMHFGATSKCLLHTVFGQQLTNKNVTIGQRSLRKNIVS